MSSNYPGSLDNFSTSHADGVNEEIHASTINDLADAVNKIETALGTNPVLGSAGLTSTSATAAMTSSAASGATTITIPNQPSWVRAGQRIVIDPYTSICESATITSVSGSTVTLRAALANNHAANTLIYCPPNGLFNVEWWGAKGDGSTAAGNEVPFNAAATAASGAYPSGTPGAVWVPRGKYYCSGQINLPKGVGLLGEGSAMESGGSIIKPQSDFGSGKYLVLCSNRNDGRNLIRDVSIFADVSSRTLGVAPKNMSGLGIGSGSYVQNCCIQGFYGGLGILGNHSQFENLDLQNCYYNVHFEDDATGTYGFGNHFFKGIQMSSPTMAACGVGGASVISFTTWEDVDAGTGPFCFYKETYINQPFMTMVKFVNLNAEQWTNGVFWDSNSGSVSQFDNVTIDAPGGISEPSAGLAATNVRVMNLDYVDSLDFDARCLQPNPGGFTGLTDAFISANRFANTRVRAADAIFPLLTNGGKVFRVGTGDASCSWITKDGSAGGYLLSIHNPGTAVTAGQLLQVVNDHSCDIYSSGTPMGFAYAAGGVGDVFPVQTWGTLNNVPCTGTVAAGNYLKPSATSGSVQAATGFSDGPIVGVAYTGGTNTNIKITVRI